MPEGQQEAAGKDMRLKITSCRHIFTGHNRRGDEFSIYEVGATKDGRPINEKLRSFTSLPIGQEMDVTVKVFNSEQWGKSFTVHPKGGQGASRAAAVNDLHDRVAELESRSANQAQRIAELETRLYEVMKDDARYTQTRAGLVPAEQPRTPDNPALDEKFGADAPW